ncbi:MULTISPECIES: phosphoglycerate dehydrogenase [unclassified Undibacterium]|uniref:phosphoglycerate dehydrogenase n=2 Tax=Bacteria TaxID=2 RepID=UPI002AC943F0|nr:MULTISPECIES: phosphoglycerate dehydrogenase [unclassified Undibacterium]MEB0138517.1 phosphoglycerate dehydrogenase [Undibacterium sp. CCC2.1]MEB0173082.1 phosphoglycerate dehydrogenase [Undibacterium sp. CCC1.1]MEB0176134.1 phosphoglycerate dehydrogenase [Undibacterium sp. CCC3.4]MEB0215400.1 phosphoglycerate dehydrogenase [Undibacterium sp. 5I2]WPX42741.1 phosphoglycerate dehydrogenase [Undibacterium sp. CCC3.4]
MSQFSLDKSKIRFLMLEGIHHNAIDVLQRNGYTNIDYLRTALDEAALIEQIRTAHFIGIRSGTEMTERVLQAADKLIAIGCFCIGTNQVDLDAAMVKGIPVFNAPYSNTRSVAELVLAETILLLRGIPEKNAQLHRGAWSKSALGAFEARGKTLGIVGYGNIGSQLSVLAESLGMQVIYYDVITKLPMGNAHQLASLAALLAQADVVTLHVPETAATENMMGDAQFAKMKPGSIFINAARGSCVDIEALAAALDSKQIGAASIDVFPQEPKSNADEFVSPLRRFDNVLLTPHIGGSTLEAQANIGVEVAEKFIRYSDTGATLSAVNFPEVALPRFFGKHRLLHIHKNIPGVLSAINRIVAENGINISAQSLMTKDALGYLVMDVDVDCSALGLHKLLEIEGTISARVVY